MTEGKWLEWKLERKIKNFMVFISKVQLVSRELIALLITMSQQLLQDNVWSCFRIRYIGYNLIVLVGINRTLFGNNHPKENYKLKWL